RMDVVAWFVFFSSRRRHTRCYRDWSSDVCSSDLLIHPGIDGFTRVTEPELRAASPHVELTGLPLLVHAELPGPVDMATCQLAQEIGRASCRERGETAVVAV